MVGKGNSLIGEGGLKSSCVDLDGRGRPVEEAKRKWHVSCVWGKTGTSVSFEITVTNELKGRLLYTAVDVW